MRILLIGGAGLIGSGLEKTLTENGHETVVLDNFVGASRTSVSTGGKLITGNASSFSVLNNVFSKFQPNAVFHLADNVLEKDNSYCFELEADTCVQVATNVMRCIKQYAVEYVFFGSSCEVYKGSSRKPVKESSTTTSISYTGATKNYIESLFKLNADKFGFKFTSLRYFGIYGERYFVNPKHDVISFFVDHLTSGQPVVLVGPNIYMDIMHVDDAVQDTYIAFNHVVNGCEFEAQAVNIGSGKPVKLVELYKKVSNALVGEVIRPYVVKPRPQNRTLIANTKLISSLGGKLTVGLEDTIEQIIAFRRGTDGRQQ